MSELWLEGPLPDVAEIRRRLNLIIPSAQDPQGWARREMAAKSVFVLLYGFAVEGFDRWIRPTAVADMTDAQAEQQNPEARRQWLDRIQSSRRPRNIADRWYSENTREPIRDETLRTFVELGIVIDRPGLPTTSPKPRYALKRTFADLLSPDLREDELNQAVEQWRHANLSQATLARLVLARQGATRDSEKILVRLPNGETRRLAPGPSSILTRAVVEELAPRFLKSPAVVLLSESAHKLSYHDDEMAKAIGLDIDVSKTLPDVVLADIDAEPPLIVFVECVITDGPVNDRRKKELDEIAETGGYRSREWSYITAFHDRADSPYRRLVGSLAWGTFVWFATEPDNIVFFREGQEGEVVRLDQLLRLRSKD